MLASSLRIPVFLLTGFLGSGKTTLLNALLKEPAFANTAVVVNEFGEIGLDHFLIERSQDNVVLLDAGCLCCTISDSLHETLADLYARRVRGEIPPFERVVIETTGLAEPAPILNTLLGHSLLVPNYRLEATVVTVDALHVDALLDSQPEVAHQIAVADRLLLTKTDLVTMSEALGARLRSVNAWAPMIESVSGAQAAKAFLPLPPHQVPSSAAIRERFGARKVRAPHPAHQPRGHEHEHEHEHEVDRNRHDAHIRAHCFVLDDPASWSGIAAWWQWLVDVLGDRLLRCKGLFRLADTGEVVFIQGVQRVFHKPERLAVWPDTDHRSRLVCIVRDATENEIRESLGALQIEGGTDPRMALTQLRSRGVGEPTTDPDCSGTM